MDLVTGSGPHGFLMSPCWATAEPMEQGTQIFHWSWPWSFDISIKAIRFMKDILLITTWHVLIKPVLNNRIDINLNVPQVFFLPGLTVAIHQGNDILEHGISMLFGRFSGWSLGHSEGRKLTTSISFSSWQQRWTKRNMLSSCIIMYFLGGLPKTPVINERFFFSGRKVTVVLFQDWSWLSTSHGTSLEPTPNSHHQDKFHV